MVFTNDVSQYVLTIQHFNFLVTKLNVFLYVLQEHGVIQSQNYVFPTVTQHQHIPTRIAPQVKGYVFKIAAMLIGLETTPHSPV